MKTALIIGATGMVGTALLEQTLNSNEFEKVKIFVRKTTGIQHPKLIELIVDFDKPESWKSELKGDVLFSCMGTTLSQAGSKANQYRVDYTFQYEAALNAANNSVPAYVLVSSAGANAKSSNFYLQMKGKLDEAVQDLPFKSVQILRPGQLYGNRKNKRIAEEIALKFMFGLNKLRILKSYKPIHANEVANAMINAVKLEKSSIFTLHELFDL